MLGGGGNGKLSYSMNAYIGFKAPAQLLNYTYVEAVSNAMKPDGTRRSGSPSPSISA